MRISLNFSSKKVIKNDNFYDPLMHEIAYYHQQTLIRPLQERHEQYEKYQHYIALPNQQYNVQ